MPKKTPQVLCGSERMPAVLSNWKPAIEDTLRRLLPPPTDPSGLGEAMAYSVLAGGKRIRPVLALAAYEACGGTEAGCILEPACALEIFHTYSLIHDDLPAMDNDDLRRGKPTSHKAFGEAAAILAGDALQTLGAEILATFPKGARFASRRASVSRAVFAALGWQGMAGGQALDLAAEKRGAASLEELLRIHAMKTGALLEAALQVGAILASGDTRARRRLSRFGRAIGLAFQIVDDLLDVTGSTEQLGKTAGKDVRQGKATFPAHWGIEGALSEAERLLEESLEALSPFGQRADDLREIALYVIGRRS